MEGLLKVCKKVFKAFNLIQHQRDSSHRQSKGERCSKSERDC